MEGMSDVQRGLSRCQTSLHCAVLSGCSLRQRKHLFGVEGSISLFINGIDDDGGDDDDDDEDDDYDDGDDDDDDEDDDYDDDGDDDDDDDDDDEDDDYDDDDDDGDDDDDDDDDGEDDDGDDDDQHTMAKTTTTVSTANSTGAPRIHNDIL